MTLDRENWITPADALQAVSSVFKLSDWDAAKWLMHRVEHELLECRAELTILGDGRKFENHAVPPSFFQMPDYGWSGFPDLPLGLSLWRTGDHVHGYDEKLRVNLFGVRFSRAGIPIASHAVMTDGHPIASPPHRPEKRRDALFIYLYRLREGTCLQKRPDEARAIVEAWRGENPPLPDTVSEKYLAKFHRLGEWTGGRIANPAVVIAAVEADLAPATPR